MIVFSRTYNMNILKEHDGQDMQADGYLKIACIFSYGF